MATETKPKTQPSKMVRCPANVHAMILELRRLMGERGDVAYWLGSGGKVVHGSVADARCILSCSGLCATCCNS